MTRIITTACLLLLFVGCSDGAASSAAQEDVAPDGTNGSDGPDLADLSPDQADTHPLALLRLSDGESTSGELIATYNHNFWWTDPAAELTYALFEPSRYGEWPDDFSLELVSSHRVIETDWVDAEPGAERFQDFMRRKGFVIETSPFASLAHVITGNESYHLEENGWGDFAWDLVITDEAGSRFTGDGTRNSDHLVWREPIRLPVGGVVVDAIDEHPDNDPGSFELSLPNNLFGVHLGGQFYFYLLHLEQDSIPADIEVGDRLEAGTIIGRVGNSGVTIEPHLHMTMYWHDQSSDPLRSWSVPSEWRDIESAGSPAGPATHHEYVVPASRTWVGEFTE